MTADIVCEPGQQAGRLRRVVAHDDRAAPYREQTHHADDYREADLRGDRLF